MNELHIANGPEGIKARIDTIFRKLPLFMPWVWEMIVIMAIIGFIFGIGMGAWADMSLRK